MKFSNIIFDFDGTIVDTSKGIYHTFTKVLHTLGIDTTGLDLSEHIGPPLEYSYTKLCGSQLCSRAIELHTQIFAQDNAVDMSNLYDGIVDVIQTLWEKGCVLAVASSKFQPHADASIDKFNLRKYFSCVYGQNEKRGFKSQVLQQLIADNHWQKQQCIMIGDTLYDIEGAKQNGICSMAVTYGFGAKQQLVAAKPEFVANSPAEILQLLCN